MRYGFSEAFLSYPESSPEFFPLEQQKGQARNGFADVRRKSPVPAIFERAAIPESKYGYGSHRPAESHGQ